MAVHLLTPLNAFVMCTRYLCFAVHICAPQTGSSRTGYLIGRRLVQLNILVIMRSSTRLDIYDPKLPGAANNWSMAALTFGHGFVASVATVALRKRAPRHIRFW
jgi:hypothetical protein